MPHPYERLPLFGTGLVLAIWLIAIHAFMLFKPRESQDFFKKRGFEHSNMIPMRLIIG